MFTHMYVDPHRAQNMESDFSGSGIVCGYESLSEGAVNSVCVL